MAIAEFFERWVENCGWTAPIQTRLLPRPAFAATSWANSQIMSRLLHSMQCNAKFVIARYTTPFSF